MILTLTQGSGQCCTLSKGSPGTALGIQSLRAAGSQSALGKEDSVVHIYRCLISAHSFSSRHSVVTAGCLSCQSLPPEPPSPLPSMAPLVLSAGNKTLSLIPSFILLLALIWYEVVTPTSASAPVPGSTDTFN